MKKVLIVEDEFTSRTIMLKALSKFFDCEVAVDGSEALSAFEIARESGRPYDLVCLDINLPQLSGQEVLRGIRKFEEKVNLKPNEGVKIIMTTGVTTPSEMLRAFKDGCEGYITKPISITKLLKQIEELGISIE